MADNKDIDLSEIQTAEDEIPQDVIMPDGDASLDDLLSSEAKKDKAPDKKKIKQIGFVSLGVTLLIVLLSVYACQPKKGSMAYGICSTFLELNTPYPHTLRYKDLEGSRTAVRIYFTNTDPFGEFKLEMIECTFGSDEKMGMKLTQVTRNRRPVDSAIVRKFNLTLPTIMASDPYLVLPPNWKNPLLED